MRVVICDVNNSRGGDAGTK